MSIEIDSICDSFNKDIEKNFIALAVTVHQAHGIEACIHQFQDMGIILKGVVLLLPHPLTGRCVFAKHFFREYDEIEIIELESNIDIIQTSLIKSILYSVKTVSCLKSRRLVYFASTAINYNWIYYLEHKIHNSVINIVLLDDGGGSYFNSYRNVVRSIHHFKANQSLFISRLKGILITLANKITIKRYLKYGYLIDNRLFLVKSNESSKFERNINICKYYEDLYSSIGRSVPEAERKLFERAVVVNTQCLKENKILTSGGDFSLVEELIRRLQEKGIKTIIKPHPREIDVEKYNRICPTVYNNQLYSQEILLASTNNKPLCVVSIYSSTLLNSYGIFGIPAVSLANILRKDKSVDALFMQQLDDYIENYNGVIEFPLTIEDAVERILDLREESYTLAYRCLEQK